MGRPGFEPGTNRLKAEYSTVELATPILQGGGCLAQSFYRNTRLLFLQRNCSHPDQSQWIGTFLEVSYGFLTDRNIS